MHLNAKLFSKSIRIYLNINLKLPLPVVYLDIFSGGLNHEFFNDIIVLPIICNKMIVIEILYNFIGAGTPLATL